MEGKRTVAKKTRRRLKPVCSAISKALARGNAVLAQVRTTAGNILGIPILRLMSLTKQEIVRRNNDMSNIPTHNIINNLAEASAY